MDAEFARKSRVGIQIKSGVQRDELSKSDLKLSMVILLYKDEDYSPGSPGVVYAL